MTCTPATCRVAGEAGRLSCGDGVGRLGAGGAGIFGHTGPGRTLVVGILPAQPVANSPRDAVTNSRRDSIIYTLTTGLQ